MSLSATSSERSQIGHGAAAVAAIVAALITCGDALSSNLVTIDEVLAAFFPNAATHRESIFLTDDQVDAVEQAIGERPTSSLVTRFRADENGSAVGWVYVDTHRVRTLPETLAVIVDASGAVVAVEVVAFREPMDYLPPETWYRQFDGRRLDDDLRLKRGIRPITGATLTARATTAATRRVLAIHRVVGQGEATDEPR